MLHIVKVPGRKLAYDTSSGAVIPLSALSYKMLGALETPLAPTCPTSLRYELAKYDSEDVSETYESLYELQENGFLFAKDSGIVSLRLDGEYSAQSNEEIELLLKTAASDEHGKKFSAVGGTEEQRNYALENAKKYGLM